MTGSVDESTVDQKVPRPMRPLGESELQDFLPGFWALFKGYGYDLYRVLPGGATLSISRYDDSLEYFRGASNNIAITGQPE